jgi:hypothetical protein
MSKIVGSDVVHCSGVLNRDGHGLTSPVDAHLITYDNGIVTVSCPKYNNYRDNEKNHLFMEQHEYAADNGPRTGTCMASPAGKHFCFYRKMVPDAGETK